VTKRLQVLLGEPEWREIHKAARAERMTVAEWVRQALRTARSAKSTGDVDARLGAIRTASRYAFPTTDIDQMNAEIGRGYLGESKS
jgi:hypothetical protein